MADGSGTDRPMAEATMLAHAGRDPWSNHGIVNPPVYHASTILVRSLADHEARQAAPLGSTWRYGRVGTPTSAAFEEAVAALEGAAGAVATGSGLAAITVALSAFTRAGAHILVTDSVYAPTRAFCDGFLSAHGVEIQYYDPTIGAGIAALLRPETAVVYLESPGSQTFEVQDIPAIVAACRAHPARPRTIIDNTWSGGLYLKPLALGVDVSLQAATKYIVGHSDAMMGVISCSAETLAPIKRMQVMLGHAAGPDDLYLGLRGLRTLGVRLARHWENGLDLARWFAARPEVRRVLHPALPDDPGHALWQRDFTGACSLFGVLLQPVPRAGLAAFLDGLRYFGMGASWGGFESLVLPAHPERTRSVVPWTEEGTLLRFHIGLEDPADLKADLAAGFERMAAAA